MYNPVELILLNKPSEIARLQDHLEGLGDARGIPPRALHEMQLAVEELLTNVLNYAFTDQTEHKIKVRLQQTESEFSIAVEDDGRPFNLLEHPAPDLSKPLEQRPVGGMGIHMIRKSMDRIDYRRADGKNILTLIKRL